MLKFTLLLLFSLVLMASSYFVGLPQLADGCGYFLRLLETQEVFKVDVYRSMGHIIYETLPLLAIKWGVKSIPFLSFLYCFSNYLPSLLALVFIAFADKGKPFLFYIAIFTLLLIHSSHGILLIHQLFILIPFSLIVIVAILNVKNLNMLQMLLCLVVLYYQTSVYEGGFLILYLQTLCAFAYIVTTRKSLSLLQLFFLLLVLVGSCVIGTTNYQRAVIYPWNAGAQNDAIVHFVDSPDRYLLFLEVLLACFFSFALYFIFKQKGFKWLGFAGIIGLGVIMMVNSTYFEASWQQDYRLMLLIEGSLGICLMIFAGLFYKYEQETNDYKQNIVLVFISAALVFTPFVLLNIKAIDYKETMLAEMDAANGKMLSFYVYTDRENPIHWYWNQPYISLVYQMQRGDKNIKGILEHKKKFEFTFNVYDVKSYPKLSYYGISYNIITPY